MSSERTIGVEDRQDDILQFLEDVNLDLPLPLVGIDDDEWHSTNPHEVIDSSRWAPTPPPPSMMPPMKKRKSSDGATVVSNDGSSVESSSYSSLGATSPSPPPTSPPPQWYPHQQHQHYLELEKNIPTYKELPLTVTTKAMMVSMSPDERALYESVLNERKRIYSSESYQTTPTKSFVLEQKLLAPLSMNFLMMQWDDAKQSSASKIQRVLCDITHQRRTKPSTRIVVFTQYSRILNTLAQLLKQNDIKPSMGAHSCPSGDGVVLLLSPYSSSTKKNFSLTNIHTVYFMESFIDPWIEIKALKRVEFTPQIRNLTVKKVIFEASVEENLLEWQKLIIDGKTQLENGDTVNREGIQILSRGLI